MELGVHPPDRLGRVRLQDGRALGWSEWGPADGVPVLLCPGAATSRRLGFGTHVLRRHGVLLVSADRPGLGASDGRPGRTLLDWAADVRELCAARALALDAVVGFSQGGPFALAVAAAGLVRAAAVVAGTDELARPELRSLLEPEVAGMVDAVRADPDGIERSVASRADAVTLRRLVQELSGPEDQQLYARPEFEAAFTAALAEGFARGAGGYARDVVLSLSPWPFDPRAVDVPVDLWYGERDASPVHSPDHGSHLGRRLPSATRHVLPDAGGALLWTHADAVLRDLLAHP